MKRIDIKVTALTCVVALFVWCVFSALGVVPELMSVPLPSWLKTYNSNLYLTGRTYRNELIKISEENTVEPGSFSKLELFKNANLQSTCYSIVDDKTIFFGLGNDVYKFDKKDYSFDTISEEGYGVIFPIGREYEVALSPKNDPALYHKDVYYRENPYYQSFYRYNKTAKNKREFAEYVVIDHLINSEKEYISNSELVSLIYLVYEEKLLYWSYEDKVAIFQTENEEGVSEIRKYDITKEYIEGGAGIRKYEYDSFTVSDYVIWQVVSKNEVVGYNEETKIIELWNLDTDTKKGLLCEVPDIRSLNYCYTEEGELVVGGIVSEKEAFWDYTNQKGSITYSIDSGYMYYLAMDQKDISVICASNNHDPSFGYFVGNHGKLKPQEG